MPMNRQMKTGTYLTSIGVSMLRYHRDTKNIPSNVRGKGGTKRELKRIVNDINQPNQIFLTKPANTSYGHDIT